MAGFDINTAEVHDESNGNKYYIIPAETTIYRGATNSVLNNDPPPFFGFVKEDVEQYGTVFDYTFNTDVTLLAIMEMDKESDFYKTASKSIKQILNINFGYENTKIRGSTPESDRSIMRYLCELKKKTPDVYKIYNGYGMNGKTNTDTGNIFHAELAICGDSFNFKNNNKFDLTGSPQKVKRPEITGPPRVSGKKRRPIDYGGRIRFKKKGKRTKKVTKKYKKTRVKRKRGGNKNVTFKVCEP